MKNRIISLPYYASSVNPSEKPDRFEIHLIVTKKMCLMLNEAQARLKYLHRRHPLIPPRA